MFATSYPPCGLTPDHSRHRTKSSNANTQHIARVVIVSHQWLNGSRTQITKMTNNNNNHAGRFREGGGSSPLVFAGIAITEVAAALKKDAESQSITLDSWAEQPDISPGQIHFFR